MAKETPRMRAGYPAEVTAANWQFPPYNRWGFCNCRRLLPTARIARSSTPHVFARQPLALETITAPEPVSAERKSLSEVSGRAARRRGRVCDARGSCTLRRDAAAGGCFHGRQIVPERWIAESSVGDRAAYARNGYATLFPRGAYSRLRRIADTSGAYASRSAFMDR